MRLKKSPCSGEGKGPRTCCNRNKKGWHPSASLSICQVTWRRAAYSQQGSVISSQQSPLSQQGSAANAAVEASIKAKVASIFFMVVPWS